MRKHTLVKGVFLVQDRCAVSCIFDTADMHVEESDSKVMEYVVSHMVAGEGSLTTIGGAFGQVTGGLENRWHVCKLAG